ncbi:hypothetical protein HZA97_04485 [Candidatus Woesearchaeota archaeon]|nr:hypothetical protein [Candidatus Woesearchaeota archaeon]
MNKQEEIKNKAYCVAKSFGKKNVERGVNWEYLEHTFCDEGLEIFDGFQTIEEKAGTACFLTTQIRNHGELVYHSERDHLFYEPGEWEIKLNELYNRLRKNEQGQF